MKDREFKICVAISDLHIGNRNVSVESMKNQLRKNFFTPISDMKYLDGIFITGDVSHDILSLNSEYSNLYLWFFNKVYKIAKKKYATVIVVKGTASHENNQLKNIKYLENNDEGVDFRIYETIESITIWDDYKVLILPDIKLRPKEYHMVDDLLKKEDAYDIILGHGLTTNMEFFVQESENMPMKTYTFDVRNLIKASKGPIFFGHIHQGISFYDQFYYVGSFTLLEQGVVNPGFLVCGIYDKDRSKFTVEHYDNTDSAKYVKLEIDENLLASAATSDIINAIDEIIHDLSNDDKILLKIIRGDDLSSADKIMVIENRYRKDKRFTITKKIKSKHEMEKEKEQAERRERFSYLMDNNMEVPAILYQYYVHDVVPTMPNRDSVEANITEKEFFKALNMEMRGGIITDES